MKFDYDLIVIGGGASGLVGSKLALGLGKRFSLLRKINLAASAPGPDACQARLLLSLLK